MIMCWYCFCCCRHQIRPRPQGCARRRSIVSRLISWACSCGCRSWFSVETLSSRHDLDLRGQGTTLCTAVPSGTWSGAEHSCTWPSRRSFGWWMWRIWRTVPVTRRKWPTRVSGSHRYGDGGDGVDGWILSMDNCGLNYI